MFGEDIIARTEQREIVLGDPFQKLDRFGDLLDRQRRRVGSQLGDDVANPRQHRLPVLHADADIGENAGERVDDFGPLRRIVHAVDMQVDEAFALAADRARALEVDEPAGEIALDHEYRMDQQADIEAASIELRQDEVDQERHIVVDDFQHRRAARRGSRLEAQLGRAGLALGEERPRCRGDRGELFGAVALQVLRHRKAEQFGEEIFGDVAVALCQQRRGGIDQRHAGTIIAAAGNVLDVHAPLNS